MRIPRTDQGRRTPNAIEQTKGIDYFGNKKLVPQKFENAPEQAFGDTSGQIALANAVKQAGNVMLDVGIRETRIKQAEEDTRYRRLQKEYGLREKELRQQLEKEKLDNGWNAEQQYQAYTERLQKIRDDLYGNQKFEFISPERIKNDIDQQTQQYDLAYRAGTLEKQRVEDYKYNKAKAFDTYANNGLYDGQNNDRAKFISNMNEIEKEAADPAYIATVGGTYAASELAKSKYGYMKNFIKGLVDKNPDDAEKYLNDEEFLKNLSEEDRAVFVQDLQDAIDKKRSEITTTNNAIQTELKGQIKLGIMQGDVSRKDILDNPTLTDGNKASLIKFFDDYYKKEIQAFNDYNQVEARAKTTPGYYAGAKITAADRKQIDNAWTYKQREFAQIKDPLQKTQAVVEYVSNVGYIPTELQRTISSAINSENPEQLQYAIGLYASIEKETNGRIQHDLDPDTLAIMEMVKRGRNIKDAKEIVQKSYMIPDEVKKTYQKASKDLTEKEDEYMLEPLNDLFGIGVGDQNEIHPMAKYEWQQTFNNNLIKTNGDKEAALTLTKQQFSKIWGVNKVDGSNRLMKFAPPAQDWAVNQFNQDMKQAGIDPNKVMIEIDPNTITKPRDQWSYILVDKRTGAVIKNEQGYAFRWKPDQNEYYKNLVEKKKKEREVKPSRTARRRKKGKQ